jgi:hypothetical protein
MTTPTCNQFDNPISTEEAYRLICLLNADEGGRDAISARGWLMYSSWYDERMPLSDGSYIYREPYVDAHLCHSNITALDVLKSFDSFNSYMMGEVK